MGKLEMVVFQHYKAKSGWGWENVLGAHERLIVEVIHNIFSILLIANSGLVW